MKSLIYVALAVFALALVAEQSQAGGSFFSLNIGSRNFRNDAAFRAGFRAAQRQQFNGHRNDSFRLGFEAGRRQSFRLNLNDHCN